MAVRLHLTGSGSRLLERGTISIGRGERNDWVLPDPERHLSKTHCVLSVENGAVVLTDCSTNGVRINGARQPTERDSRTVLTDGDEVRLGDYVLMVEAVADARAARVDAGSDDPLDVDPLDDPLAHRPDQSFSHPIRHAPATQRQDDPFDEPERDRRGGRRPDPGEDRFQGVQPAHEWAGPSQRDDADAPRHAMLTPRVVAAPAARPGEIDFDALIGDLSALQPPARPSAAHATPAGTRPVPARNPFAEFDDLIGSGTPAPQAPAPAAAPATAPAAGQADEAAGLRAFLEGAGVPGLLVGDDPQLALRTMGEVFRALTEGLRSVLMSRAAIKNELRVEQTLMRTANNNPLKFSFSVDDAVMSLMSVGRTGYMPPVQAAREAFDDIRQHELSVMAGVQTALLGLLQRFDPDAIEARLVQGKLSGVLPGARKARLWESFRELHHTIAGEAEDDFQAVFGRAFAKAYSRAGAGTPAADRGTGKGESDNG